MLVPEEFAQLLDVLNRDNLPYVLIGTSPSLFATLAVLVATGA
jgi:hypothetical protein